MMRDDIGFRLTLCFPLVVCFLQVLVCWILVLDWSEYLGWLLQTVWLAGLQSVRLSSADRIGAFGSLAIGGRYCTFHRYSMLRR